MSAYTDALAAQVLAAGNRATWVEQTAYEGIPASDSAGVALGGALAVMADVQLREVAHARTAYVTVKTLGTAETWTTTINGTAVAFVAGGGDDLEEVAAGIAAAIMANGTVNVIVAAVVEAYVATGDSDPLIALDGLDVVVRIRGLGEADFYINAAVSTGGDLNVQADAITATASVWYQYGGGGAKPTGWRRVPGTSAIAVDTGGYPFPLSTPSLNRVYVQLADVTGHASDGGAVTPTATVSIGPSLYDAAVVS